MQSPVGTDNRIQEALRGYTGSLPLTPNTAGLLLEAYFLEPSSSTNLWSVRHVFGAVSDEADGFHACVGEGGVTGKLGQALHCILEGVDGGQEVLLKYIRCDGGKKMTKKKTFTGLFTHRYVRVKRVLL